ARQAANNTRQNRPTPATDRAASDRAERTATNRPNAARLAIVRTDLDRAHAVDNAHAHRLFALRLRRRIDIRGTAVVRTARHGERTRDHRAQYQATQRTTRCFHSLDSKRARFEPFKPERS